MKSVKVLPAMPFREGEFQKKRVAAYCRISTEFEAQKLSGTDGILRGEDSEQS